MQPSWFSYQGAKMTEKKCTRVADLLGEAKELETTAIELLGNVIDVQ